jgi:hypothetical protein
MLRTLGLNKIIQACPELAEGRSIVVAFPALSAANFEMPVLAIVQISLFLPTGYRKEPAFLYRVSLPK